MTRERVIIPFFTDQNVPDSVGNALIDAKHQVIRLRDVMDTETPDPIIAIACATGGQVLITHDADFRQVAKRLKVTQRQYHRSLHRIHLRCPEPKAADRVIDALSLIEAEWFLARPDRPMVIDINLESLRTHR